MSCEFVTYQEKLKNYKLFYCLFTLTAASIFFTGVSHAQNSSSSPYSRFGIGDLSSITFARNLGLGGTEIGLNQPGFINYGNPAAYSNLWFTTYEAGADFKQYELQTSNSLHRTHTASVSYFDFAFPIKPQKWSLGFGLLPYSKVGYTVREVQNSQYGDEETRTYEGSGGLNNFHIGSGLKISKKVSFGVNAEYLFGAINNNRTVSFRNPYYFNTSIDNSTSIGSFHFKTGFQFAFDSLPVAKSDSIIEFEKKIILLEDSLGKLISESSDTTQQTYLTKNQLRQEIATTKMLRDSVVVKKVKSDWHLVLGITGAPAANLRARNSTLVNSFRYFIPGQPELGLLVRDTVLNTEGEPGNVRLPLSLGFGFSLLKGSRWLFCADYSLQQWSDFSFLGTADSLNDSWKVSAGIQFTPNDRAIKSYWKLMQYRVGFHYEKGFLNLNNNDINEMGVSLGFGLPIRKAGTFLHFTFEAGNRGTTDNNLILERYLKFTLGLTINDRWFVKPKLD
jgi:hypothetical protein